MHVLSIHFTPSHMVYNYVSLPCNQYAKSDRPEAIIEDGPWPKGHADDSMLVHVCRKHLVAVSFCG